ncbi:unnamed protein product, partial [Discosporangium mesarthrocarpum]
HQGYRKSVWRIPKGTMAAATAEARMIADLRSKFDALNLVYKWVPSDGEKRLSSPNSCPNTTSRHRKIAVGDESEDPSPVVPASRRKCPRARDSLLEQGSQLMHSALMREGRRYCIESSSDDSPVGAKTLRGRGKLRKVRPRRTARRNVIISSDSDKGYDSSKSESIGGRACRTRGKPWKVRSPKTSRRNLFLSDSDLDLEGSEPDRGTSASPVPGSASGQAWGSSNGTDCFSDRESNEGPTDSLENGATRLRGEVASVPMPASEGDMSSEAVFGEESTESFPTPAPVSAPDGSEGGESDWIVESSSSSGRTEECSEGEESGSMEGFSDDNENENDCDDNGLLVFTSPPRPPASSGGPSPNPSPVARGGSSSKATPKPVPLPMPLTERLNALNTGGGRGRGQRPTGPVHTKPYPALGALSGGAFSRARDSLTAKYFKEYNLGVFGGALSSVRVEW